MNLIRYSEPGTDSFAGIDRWCDNAFASFGLSPRLFSRIEPIYGTLRPAVRLGEEGDDYVLRFEVPGVKKEDITLELNDSVMALKAERKETRNDEEIAVSLSRSVRVSEEVRADQMKANLKDGVLTVTIPKPEERKPKLIAIN